MILEKNLHIGLDFDLEILKPEKMNEERTMIFRTLSDIRV